MRLYITVIIVFLIIINSQAQEINYEAFKGEPINVSMDVDLEGFKFYWLNHPDIDEEKRSRITTIEKDNLPYASSPVALLTKIYHAESKKELLSFVTDKELVKKFRLKKVNNYEENYFIAEYLLSVPTGKKGVSILKYSEFKDNKKVGEYTLQSISKRGRKVTDIEELKGIEFIVASLSAEMFLEFYRTYDSEDEEINKLRAKVRSQRLNMLNLTRLAEVLQEIQKSDKTLWAKLTIEK